MRQLHAAVLGELERKEEDCLAAKQTAVKLDNCKQQLQELQQRTEAEASEVLCLCVLKCLLLVSLSSSPRFDVSSNLWCGLSSSASHFWRTTAR